MQIHGIVRTAMLQENPPGTDRIEMMIWGQGVGPNKPRQIVVPFELLIADPSLDPDAVQRHAFQAEIQQDATSRWLVVEIGSARRHVLEPVGSGN